MAEKWELCLNQLKALIKDIQKWIESEFLKSSYALFTNSIAYPQENDGSFVKDL